MPGVATVRDLRRSQILAVARRLVADEGLGGLTIAALERNLEFSRGVITYHFENKDEIVAAVLESATEEIDRATSEGIGAALDPAEGLRAILSTKVRGFLDHPEAGRTLLSFWGRLQADPTVTAANADLFRRYRQQAARYLEESLGVAPDRAATLGALVVGNVIGIVLLAVFEPGSIDVEAAIDEAAAGLLARVRGP